MIHTFIERCGLITWIYIYPMGIYVGGFESIFPGLIELFILKQTFSWLVLPIFMEQGSFTFTLRLKTFTKGEKSFWPWSRATFVSFLSIFHFPCVSLCCILMIIIIWQTLRDKKFISEPKRFCRFWQQHVESIFFDPYNAQFYLIVFNTWL